MTVLTTPSGIATWINLSYQVPLIGAYSYLYEKGIRLVRTGFPSGKQINNFYDKTRLVRIQTPEGNIDLDYLCGTKLSSILKDTESIAYEYDGSLVTSKIQPFQGDNILILQWNIV